MSLLGVLSNKEDVCERTSENRTTARRFDVSEEAPGTYRALKAHLDTGKRLVVYSGGSYGTIYVDPQVNYAFRAWHDYTHWQEGFDFSVEGETAVCHEQCRQIIERYGDTTQTRRWCDILRAEIIGQRLFYQYHKKYVVDQRTFIEEYIKDPELTLMWSLG